MREVWRDIPGYEGEYQASSLGRVRSLDRFVSTNNQYGSCVKRCIGKVLRPSPNSQGYLYVQLNGKSMPVHRLVCMAFYGNPPEGRNDAAHRDDDRLNNLSDNLYWASRAENIQDMIRNGRHFQSNQTHCKRGHEFTESNTFHSPVGRVCRACKRSYYREYMKVRRQHAV